METAPSLKKDRASRFTVRIWHIMYRTLVVPLRSRICVLVFISVLGTGYGKNGDLSQKFWSTKDPGQKPFTFNVGMGSGKWKKVTGCENELHRWTTGIKKERHEREAICYALSVSDGDQISSVVEQEYLLNALCCVVLATRRSPVPTLSYSSFVVIKGKDDASDRRCKSQNF